MSKQELDDILYYAKVNHLEHTSFKEVLDSYNKDLEQWYYSDLADSQLSAMKDACEVYT